MVEEKAARLIAAHEKRRLIAVGIFDAALIVLNFIFYAIFSRPSYLVCATILIAAIIFVVYSYRKADRAHPKKRSRART